VAQPVTYVHQANQGAGVARQRGLDEARGEFVAFMDSDDPWLPHHLEACVRGLVDNPDVGWVVGPATVVDQRKARVLQANSFFDDDAPGAVQSLQYEQRSDLRVIVDPAALDRCITHDVPGGLQASVFRRAMLDGVRFRRYRTFEDRAFKIELLAHGVRAGYFVDPHITYRIHGQNVSLVADDGGAMDKRERSLGDGITVFTELTELPQIGRRHRALLRRQIAGLLFWDLGYNTYLKSGRHREALRAFVAALKLTPADAAMWKTTAVRTAAAVVPWGRRTRAGGAAGIVERAFSGMEEAEARLLRLLRTRALRRGCIVCAAPVPEQNRGDQALLDVAIEQVRKRGCTPIVVCTTSNLPVESFTQDAGLQIRSEFFHVFVTGRARRERLAFLSFASRFQDLLVIGADVLDGGYGAERSESTLHAIGMANRAGLRTRVLGFSVNAALPESVRQRVLSLGGRTRLFARDPATYRRVKSAGISGAEASADLAFLLEPADESAVDEETLRFVAAAGGRVFGLNLTSVVLGAYGMECERLAIVAEACRRLIVEDGWRILLIPHDQHSEPTGVEYLADFQKRFDAGSAPFTRLVAPLPHARVLKRIAGMCAHVFTCRLHLGIATLGMGRPMTGFPYQGKFEGQFELFGLSPEGLVDAAHFPASGDQMLALMRRRLKQSDDLAVQVQRRLPDVLALAARNFDGLGDQRPA
jgi:polysaccharide pyruvyl transferase WcaK-like protein